MKPARTVVALALVAALAAAACGASGSDSPAGDETLTTLSAEERVLRFRTELADPDPASLETTASSLTERLHRAGLPDAEVRVDGTTVVVRLPAGSTPVARRLTEEVTRPGVLTFRPVVAEGAGISATDLTPTTSTPALNGTGPDGTPLVLGPAALEGGIASATAAADATGWQVVPEFKVDLTPLLDAMGRCVRREPECPTGKLAVVVDGEVLSVGEVNPMARRVVIAGSFDEIDAKALAAVLSTGPLPMRLVREA
ncbi:MAG: hypothetical protein WHS89_04335 [Acidimicrobiales bacterium]